MLCPNCGNANNPNAVLCQFCGKPLQTNQPSDNPTTQINYGRPEAQYYYQQTQYNTPTYQNNSNMPSTATTEPTLVFNIIYSIFLFLIALYYLGESFTMTLGALGQFEQLGILGLLAVIALYVVPAAFHIATGVLLLKCKKIGYILCKILNIWGIVSASFGVIASILSICIPTILASYIGTITEDTAGLTVVLAFIGVFALFFFAISIVLNAIVMRYYSKRKHRFV